MGNCCCCIPSEQEITVDKQNEDMNNNETVDIVDNVKDENVESNDENGELDNAENERLIEEENDNGECENACITENNENVSEKLDDKSVDKDSLESDKEDDTHFYGSGRIYDNEEKISERDSSLRRGLTDSTYACQKIASSLKKKVMEVGHFPVLAKLDKGLGRCDWAVARHAHGFKLNYPLKGTSNESVKQSYEEARHFIYKNQQRLGVKYVDDITTSIYPYHTEKGGSVLLQLLLAAFSRYTAFFGQVTVDGEVLEVAGVKEKLGAAHGVGITNIILPECMKNEIEGLTQETLKTFKFIYISDFFDSLKYLFP
uniref:Lon proteolytic domain-containing protein n=1 Tax=Meloidogyne enterolobii TaxID=390850 RepID=A0A6V7W129_MELEN|nr:unnamed protein product [Meloidogyne enterolobii]